MKQKLLFFLLTFLVFSCGEDDIAVDPCIALVDEIKINQIQAIGSHNSYRQRTLQSVLDFVFNLDPSDLQGNDPREWDYDHLPLPQQLGEYGMRSFELDIYHDPLGGHYYDREALALIDLEVASNEPKLLEPGFKLIHIIDVDFMTNYFTFTDALEAIKAWSDANPDHFPITIMVEPKTTSLTEFLPLNFLTEALPFTQGAIDSIDLEINSVFGNSRDQLITPDDIRKGAATLEDAIRNDGWPTLGASRGKIMFVLSGYRNEYLNGHPGGEGRLFFRFAEPGDDEAAFIKRDSPSDVEAIQALVQQGYYVRTRADAGTLEARSGDHSRKENAFASGAQMISTDYYKPDERAGQSAEWSDYFVEFPDKAVARQNPVNLKPALECLLTE